MTNKLIAQGAEAKIILTNHLIIKNRISKSYRIPELDEKIRKRRTKVEIRLLKKASEVINTPMPEEQEEFNKIKMPFIDGKKLSIYLDKFSIAKQKLIAKKIGEEIAKLHNENIIHGDLTTSNMILIENEKKKKGSNGMEPAMLIPNYDINNKQKYLNVSINSKKNCAGMAEWSTQSVDTGCPSGRVGSIPTPSAEKNPKIFFIDFGLGYFNGKIEDKAVDLHLLKQALEAKHFKNYKILWKVVKKGYKNYKDSKKVFERLTAVEKRGRYKK